MLRHVLPAITRDSAEWVLPHAEDFPNEAPGPNDPVHVERAPDFTQERLLKLNLLSPRRKRGRRGRT